MKRMSLGSAAVPMDARTRVVRAASQRRSRTAPPADRAGDTMGPWLLALIVLGALAMAGVLIVVLARLVALPVATLDSTPGPAPLSRSRHPSVEESETHGWSGQPDPAYTR